jgi:hypothetical protein
MGFNKANALTIALPLAALGVLGGLGVSQLFTNRISVAAAHSTRNSRLVVVEGMGIQFNPAADATAAQPTLPDGQKAALRAQALAVAMEHTAGARNQRLLPNVQVNAQFGMITDGQLAQRLPSGAVRPLLQNRPVWLVTFSGPGVQIGFPDHLRTGPVQIVYGHEDNIVIDGATGAYIESFTYR